MPIPVKEIPDKDKLYYRVHICDIDEESGMPKPGAFKERGDPGTDERGMSTNWSELSKPLDVVTVSKDPSKNSCYSAVVGDVRKISELVVVHAPLDDNPSHTNVKGIPQKKILKVRIRRKLQQIFKGPITE